MLKSAILWLWVLAILVAGATVVAVLAGGLDVEALIIILTAVGTIAAFVTLAVALRKSGGDR